MEKSRGSSRPEERKNLEEEIEKIEEEREQWKKEKEKIEEERKQWAEEKKRILQEGTTKLFRDYRKMHTRELSLAIISICETLNDNKSKKLSV